MKLNFPILDQSIDLETFTLLVLEDVQVFADFTRQLYQYDEESRLKIFDKEHKNVKSSELLIVTDILGYEINSPAVLKLIHADLEQQLNEKPEVKSMIERLVTTITDLLSYECLENELDLEYDEITLLELIKSLGVKVETRSDTIFEKIFEILQVFHYLSKKKLLVFVNVFSYLTEPERQEILDYIQLAQLRVLFVEPRKVANLPQYVLDKDYFLITENMV